MHAFVIFMLMGAAFVIVTLLFIVWVVSVIFRGIGRLFLGPGLKSQQKPIATRQPPTRPCPHASCKAINPVEARFCRRCGRRMDEVQYAPVRRVAML